MYNIYVYMYIIHMCIYRCISYIKGCIYIIHFFFPTADQIWLGHAMNSGNPGPRQWLFGYGAFAKVCR